MYKRQLSNDIRTVRQLIEKADGLREDAFQFRGLIERRSPTLEKEVVSFDVARLMSGQAADIQLQREDVVIIRAIQDLTNDSYVVVSGAVNKADTLAYADSMSIADAITLAGGFSEGATGSRVEVSRRIRTDRSSLDSVSIRTFTFTVDKSLRLRAEDATFHLEPYDVVQVRYIPGYEVQRQVRILGQVLYPSYYVIKNRDERITDLLARAGGLTPEAYLPDAQFIRRGELVALNLNEILRNPSSSANLRLEAGDELRIPKRNQLVRIQGAVLNPSLVNHQNGWRLDDYLAQAGGTNDNAWRRKIYVTYPNGRVVTTLNALGFYRSPVIRPGSVINVPARERTRNRLEPGERIAIFSLVGSLLIATATVASVLLRR